MSPALLWVSWVFVLFGQHLLLRVSRTGCWTLTLNVFSDVWRSFDAHLGCWLNSNSLSWEGLVFEPEDWNLPQLGGLSLFLYHSSYFKALTYLNQWCHSAMMQIRRYLSPFSIKTLPSELDNTSRKRHLSINLTSSCSFRLLKGGWKTTCFVTLGCLCWSTLFGCYSANIVWIN